MILADICELCTPSRWRKTLRLEVVQRSLRSETESVNTPWIGSLNQCSLRALIDCSGVRGNIGIAGSTVFDGAMEPNGRLEMESGRGESVGRTLTVGDDHVGSAWPSTFDTGRRTGSFQPEFIVVVKGVPVVGWLSDLSIWGG